MELGSQMRENVATNQGRELGFLMAHFCNEALMRKEDKRCGTCAFRHGNHLANGSPETQMLAFKCVWEGEPFLCHEENKVCAGWKALAAPKDQRVRMPWEYQDCE